MGNIPQSAAVFKHCNPASLSQKIWDKLSRGHAQTPANIGAKTFSGPSKTDGDFPRVPPGAPPVRVRVRAWLPVSTRGDAAATSPAVPKGAWLRPRPARQSRDCLRGRVHRQASLLRRLARLPAAASPARHVWSAPSFVWGGLCGSLGYRSRLRRKTRHASAGDGAARLVGIPPVAPASAPAAPATPRRLRSLRLTPPHCRPAPHLRSTADGIRRGRVSRLREACGAAPRMRGAPLWRTQAVQAATLAPRRERTGRTARKWRGGGERGQSAIRRPHAADAARDGRGRDGRHPDQARRAVSADGCRVREERRMRGGGARRRTATPCARANRGGQRARSRAAFAQRSGPQPGRTRRQSGDWRAVRTGSGTPSARGKARLARCPPHDDRHSPHTTFGIDKAYHKIRDKVSAAWQACQGQRHAQSQGHHRLQSPPNHPLTQDDASARSRFPQTPSP